MSVLGTFSSGAVLTAAELNQLNNVTALKASTTSIPTSTLTYLEYTTAGQKVVDVSNWHSTSTNPSRITVDKDGIYLVGAYCQYNYSGAAADFSVGVSQNTTIVLDGYIQSDAFPGCNVSGIFSATAGNYFRSWCYQTSGSTQSILSGRQYFYCVLLRTT